MKISTICKNYFSSFYKISNCQHNDTRTNVKILSYFTVVIPLGFAALYVLSSFCGCIIKKKSLFQQDENIHNQAKKIIIKNDQPKQIAIDLRLPSPAKTTPISSLEEIENLTDVVKIKTKPIAKVVSISFSSMPMDLKNIVFSFIFIQPRKITNEEVTNCARQIKDISVINTEFNDIFRVKLANLKKINGLVKKYSEYNSDYEKPGYNSKTKKEFDPKGNPQLLDALFTGCELFAKSTFRTYTSEIEEDIKKIVELTPQSMNCILGTLRCIDEVPPLAAACFNTNIPIHIIEFLLKKGANPNATLKINNHAVRILSELKNCLEEDRFTIIKKLFIEYGAVGIYPE